ncbi:MAG: HAD-IIIA family hydrolase [Deltaproteobacteria bacterium]|nr:HAD-IIIA family hydrolase [Deltaproteobacteria bacterium]
MNLIASARATTSAFIGALIVTLALSAPATAAPAAPAHAPRLPQVRPTPTAPRMSVRRLKRLGIKVVRDGHGGLATRLTPHFDAAAARRLGLVSISGQTPHLRFVPNLLRHAHPALYPRARRQLASSYTPPKKGRLKIAFLDADGTLRVSRSGAPTADHAADVALLPGVAQKIKALAKRGYLIAIVSNQAGVEAGFISHAIAEAGLRNTCRLLSQAGAPVHYFDYAAKRDANRKPNATMGERLAHTLADRYGRQVDWKHSMMIGDAAWKRGVDTRPDGKAGDDFSNSDRRFAETLRRVRKSPKGVAFHHPRDVFGWAKRGVERISTLAELRTYLGGETTSTGKGRSSSTP